MCVAVKRERGEAGRRGGTKACVTTDHTNGCWEAAIKSENCLCVGMGTSVPDCWAVNERRAE